MLGRLTMSQHDLVSAQSSSVCITRHVALNSIACVETGVGGLVYIYPKG